MTEHVLKTLAPYWEAIERGDKTFEVRRDDRNFQLGDVLVLSPVSVLTEGRVLRRRVTYVLAGGQFGIEPGYVVMGLAT